MLRAGSTLKGLPIEATDGRFGVVSDFLFDERIWKIHWMVVDTGGWLAGREVLISPSAITALEDVPQKISVQATMEQVRQSPPVLAKQAVTQQIEKELLTHYGWEPRWGMEDLRGETMANPQEGLPGGVATVADGAPVVPTHLTEREPHLHSIVAITGCHIQAVDGAAGHVGDFLVDDQTWSVQSLITDTGSWWSGDQVLLQPSAVTEIDVPHHRIQLSVARDQVKNGPIWQPQALEPHE